MSWRAGFRNSSLVRRSSKKPFSCRARKNARSDSTLALISAIFFPKPIASQKLYAQEKLYSTPQAGFGHSGAVNYLFRVLRATYEWGAKPKKKVKKKPLCAAVRRSDFRALFGTVFAFFAGGLWGIYATQYGVQRITRLAMAPSFGGGRRQNSRQ